MDRVAAKRGDVLDRETLADRHLQFGQKSLFGGERVGQARNIHGDLSRLGFAFDDLQCAAGRDVIDALPLPRGPGHVDPFGSRVFPKTE